MSNSPSSPRAPAKCHCERDSYIRATKKPLDVIYDLPGMAEKMGSNDMTGYSFGPTPCTRDTHIKAAQKFLDINYDLPTMVDLIRRDPRGTRAFKNEPGDRSASYISPHTKEVIRREPYNVPGIAEEAVKKPYGFFVECCSECTSARTRAASASPEKMRRSHSAYALPSEQQSSPRSLPSARTGRRCSSVGPVDRAYARTFTYTRVASSVKPSCNVVGSTSSPARAVNRSANPKAAPSAAMDNNNNTAPPTAEASPRRVIPTTRVEILSTRGRGAAPSAGSPTATSKQLKPPLPTTASSSPNRTLLISNTTARDASGSLYSPCVSYASSAPEPPSPVAFNRSYTDSSATPFIRADSNVSGLHSAARSIFSTLEGSPVALVKSRSGKKLASAYWSSSCVPIASSSPPRGALTSFSRSVTKVEGLGKDKAVNNSSIFGSQNMSVMSGGGLTDVGQVSFVQ